MNSLLQYKYDILASVYLAPCSLQVLCTRDFCRDLPIWAIVTYIHSLEKEGYIRQTQSGEYRAIRGKARKKLNALEYEIE